MAVGVLASPAWDVADLSYMPGESDSLPLDLSEYSLLVAL